ncbi:uncharacterized protein BDV17DRAFT_64840 [Aspergillus undulatus]|uniref:uncharacterized protein n=1 Tax=Aspergillus undulatus TaxID=1810928 RepID=UPI003CCD5659
MKVSSCFIELPTAPFVHPTRVEEPVITPGPILAPVPSPNEKNGTSTSSNGLAGIVPKPAVTYTTPVPVSADSQVPAAVQLPSEHRPSSSNNINGANFKPPGPINLAPKQLAVSTPVSVSAEPQVPATTQLPSEDQQPSTNDIDGTLTEPHAPANIAPKPAVTRPKSPSVPAVPPPADVRPPLNYQPPPAPSPVPVAPVPAARAPLILKISRLSLLRLSAGIPVKAAYTSRQRRSIGKGSSRKRKRGHGSDGEDIIRAVDSSSDESDTAPTATQTKSGRQVNRPSLYVPSPLSPALPTPPGASHKPQQTSNARKRAPRKVKSTNIICVYCQRGHSPASNTIVFCDQCNRAWHQHCHDPPIGNEVVTVKEKEWLCRECNPVPNTILYPTVVRSNPKLTTKPPVHPPLTIPKTEVGGERFAPDDRRRFLSTLSHATLVELLLTISDKNPTVPVFPENMASLPSTNFAPSQAILAGSTDTSTSLSSITTPNRISSNGLSSAPAGADGQNARRGYYYESSDDESDYEFQDHRLYPRAGNGVRLPMTEEDLDILQEDPACTTFSYALYRTAPGILANGSA